MAKGRAVAVMLDDAEKATLTALIRKHGAPQSLALRARIVLAAASGLSSSMARFSRMQEAKILIEAWRWQYDAIRPPITWLTGRQRQSS